GSPHAGGRADLFNGDGVEAALAPEPGGGAEQRAPRLLRSLLAQQRPPTSVHRMRFYLGRNETLAIRVHAGQDTEQASTNSGLGGSGVRSTIRSRKGTSVARARE